MIEALFRAIGTPAKFSPLTIDGTAKALVSHLVGGFVGFTSHVDYERAKLVMYIGVNPVVSHGHNIALSDPVTASHRGAGRVMNSRRNSAFTRPWRYAIEGGHHPVSVNHGDGSGDGGAARRRCV